MNSKIEYSEGLTFSKVAYENWHRDQKATLYNELLEIAVLYYQNPNNLLKKEFDYSNNAYTIRDLQSGKILAFCLTKEYLLKIQGNLHHVVYMGLTISAQKSFCAGLGPRVALYMIQDLVRWEKTNRDSLILWNTMANPISCKFVYEVFENVNPDICGNYDDKALDTLKEIRRNIGYPLDYYSLENPFVLLQVLDSGLHLAKETASLLISEKKEHQIYRNLFDKLNINEQNGDRLLCLSHTPEQNKLDNIIAYYDAKIAIKFKKDKVIQ